MKFKLKKSSPKMAIFMLTGIFIIILFSYDLYDYIETNEFVYEYPGDWDKPIGILVGLFLIIRSLKFIPESKSLFIEISGSHLIYRTKRSDSIRKTALSDIEKVQEKDAKIILITKDLTELIIIDFNKIRVRDNVQKSIKKSLIELN
ncbi:MAG: hypothetical protein HRT73_01165 [Flavobacteriales bacterium]|nr:hypothetical protein [Flavobacteriales bacterium]